MSAPLLVMLAGPNGAGKSTFYASFLQEFGLPFLNADILARDTGLDSYTAAKQIATLRDDYVRQRKPFVTETVLSDPVGEKVNFLRQTANLGYDVQLIYIGIESSDLSAERVATRVRAGGHDVPLDKLKARYGRTLNNLHLAIKILPRVDIYDNSCFSSPYRHIAKFRDGQLTRSTEEKIPTWAQPFLA